MNIWRPYTQMLTAKPPIALKSADGAYLHTSEGKSLFDGISSWWLITHGHARAEIASALAEQSKKLEQAVFANFTHEPAEELAAGLGSLLPSRLGHLFLSDNGSTAVEVAMKMALQFCAQSGFGRKNKFVAFTHSYHGDTCGAMSASADSAFTKPYAGMRFEVIRAAQGRSSSDALGKWTGHFEQLLKERSREICAVLLEPLIQGAGGMVIWPIEAVQRVCDLAAENDVLVIFDEVMTGFGRTGTMFALEKVGRVPDLLCLSKGLTGGFLPLGATVASSSIYEAFRDQSSEKMLFHGHSFTGNALSCAAACANLKVFREQSWDFNSIRDAHLRALSSLSLERCVREVRVCGTIGVLELNCDYSYGGALSRKIHESALNRELFIRPLGNIIYLMPPFCASASEVEGAWETIGEILSEL